MGRLKTVFIDIGSGEFKELQQGDELVGSEVPVEPDAASLRDREGYYDNQIINLLGLNAAGDGLGRNVFWNSSSTKTDDNSTVFKPDSIANADPGRWEVYFREFPNYVNADDSLTQIV